MSRSNSRTSSNSLSRESSPYRQNHKKQHQSRGFRNRSNDRNNSGDRNQSRERRDFRGRERSRSWSSSRTVKIENLQKKINELSNELSQLTLTCERCGAKNLHNTLSCPIYFQTAPNVCKKCSLGRHFNCKSSFQNR